MAIDDTIRIMTKRRTTALVIAAVVTFGVLSFGMIMIGSGEYATSGDTIIAVSIALAPVAMISVMVGYAAWWTVLLVLSLFSREDTTNDQ